VGEFLAPPEDEQQRNAGNDSQHQKAGSMAGLRKPGRQDRAEFTAAPHGVSVWLFSLSEQRRQPRACLGEDCTGSAGDPSDDDQHPPSAAGLVQCLDDGVELDFHLGAALLERVELVGMCLRAFVQPID
jgi:hypothetical protein